MPSLEAASRALLVEGDNDHVAPARVLMTDPQAAVPRGPAAGRTAWWSGCASSGWSFDTRSIRNRLALS